MNRPHALGIDVSKKTFNAALLTDKRHYSKSFTNGAAGFRQLEAWLSAKNIEKAHACLEATSIYHLDLAHYLHASKHDVSVVNPLVIAGHRRSRLTRSKTDECDAKVIASYCDTARPKLFQPVPEKRTRLQDLIKRRENLERSVKQEKNRRERVRDSWVRQSIERMIDLLEKEIERVEQELEDHIDRHADFKKNAELLGSIVGVSSKTALSFIAFVDINDFKNARQVAAFIGLTPRLNLSGTSIKGQSPMSKVGNRHLRKALYFPAISAKQHNPAIAPWAEKLSNKGKVPKAVVGAAMRKLCHIMYGVLKHQAPFHTN